MDWDSHWWRGLIRRTPSGHPIFIHATRATAELYGWAEAFDARRDATRWPRVVINNRVAATREIYAQYGGRKHWISRHPNRNGKTLGKVNQFRISFDATDADIAQVGAAVKLEWHWLTDQRRARVAREIWLHIDGKRAARPTAPSAP
jgi:hypothetical protein